jgi:hypothetical protein
VGKDQSVLMAHMTFFMASALSGEDDGDASGWVYMWQHARSFATKAVRLYVVVGYPCHCSPVDALRHAPSSSMVPLAYCTRPSTHLAICPTVSLQAR